MADQTGHADFPYPAFAQHLTPSPMSHYVPEKADVRDPTSRRGTRQDKPASAVYLHHAILWPKKCYSEAGIRDHPMSMPGPWMAGSVYSLQQQENMMKIGKVIMVVGFMGLVASGLSACEKEGPAEKAGKAIDEAASDIAEGTSETMEAIEKKVEE